MTPDRRPQVDEELIGHTPGWPMWWLWVGVGVFVLVTLTTCALHYGWGPLS